MFSATHFGYGRNFKSQTRVFGRDNESQKKKPEWYVRYPVNFVPWVFVCSEEESGRSQTGRLQGE